VSGDPCDRASGRSDASAPAIVADGLGRRFGDRLAVEGLSFRVQPGQLFGLLGPNGAGKTTTVRMLCALLASSFGAGEICGLALGRDDGAIRASVGLSAGAGSQNSRLSRCLSLEFASGRSLEDGLELAAVSAPPQGANGDPARLT
jgi:ABC-type multidrug transport system ATPase subunit